MIKVFIAGPYTKGNREENLKRMIDATNELINLGFNPLPLNLCYHLVEETHKRENYVDWIHITSEWVHVCDCLLRLPGNSRGSDNEVELAKSLNIPVFYSIEELINYYSK